MIAKKMTKKSNIFSLEYNTIINQDILNIIRNEAYTRIPVIKDGIVIGIINSKTLIGLDLNIENQIIAIGLMRKDKFLTFEATEKSDDVLAAMIEKKNTYWYCF